MRIVVGKVILFLILLLNVVSGYSATSEDIQSSQTPPPPTPPPGLPVDENIFWLAVIGMILAFVIYKKKAKPTT